MISSTYAIRSTRPWTWAIALVLANSLAIGAVLLLRDHITVPSAAAASPSGEVSVPSVGLGVVPALQQRSSRLIVVGHSGSTLGAWVVDPQTGQAGRVTAEGEDVAVVAPAPNGDELAYVVGGGQQRWSLQVRALDGSSQRSIAANRDGSVTSLAWSPRGDLLAYEVTQPHEAQVSPPRIWLAMADGSNNESLAYGRSQETGSRPVWSPDGRQVGFYENRQHVLAVFDFTSRLIAIPTRINATWSWSPDGQSVVYADRADENSPRTVNKITRLSGPGQSAVLAQGAFSDSEPAWSPVGTWIGFVRLSGTSSGVWIIRPDGSGARALHEQPGWSYSTPVWAPDGRAVAFSRHPTRAGALEQEPEVWVAPLQGEARRLDIRGSIAAWVR